MARKGRRRVARREYSRAYKLQLVREMLAPGVSASAVSRRHDVNANLLFKWRRQYSRGEWGEITDLVQVGVIGSDCMAVPGPSEICAPSAVPAPPARPGRMIEVQLKSGSVIRIDVDIKPAALRAVLKLIRGLV